VLTFYHPGKKLAGSVALGGAEKGPVTVKLQPCGTLTGRLIDEDGKPLAGLAVSVFYTDRTAFALSETVQPRKDAPRADAEGRFTLDRLFPGQKVNVGFRTDRKFYQTKPELRDLTVTAGEKRDLGALVGKPFGPGE
jgi:hypothetical protein